MSQIIDAVTAPAKKAALPWIIAAFLFAILAAGGAGMYFGYQIADAKAANDKLQLANAYNDAMAEREKRRLDAESRGRTVEGDFLTALQNMQVVNKTYNNEIVKETEKLVYTDCKLPDSGVDLLNKHIDDVNMRLIGKDKGAK